MTKLSLLIEELEKRSSLRSSIGKALKSDASKYIGGGIVGAGAVGYPYSLKNKEERRKHEKNLKALLVRDYYLSQKANVPSILEKAQRVHQRMPEAKSLSVPTGKNGKDSKA